MNDRAGSPGQGPPVQRRVNINLNEAATVGCPICGCQIFTTNVALFKKLSAIQIGKPMLAKVELCICQECGAVIQPVGDDLKLVKMAPKDGEADDADKPDD